MHVCVYWQLNNNVYLESTRRRHMAHMRWSRMKGNTCLQRTLCRVGRRTLIRCETLARMCQADICDTLLLPDLRSSCHCSSE